MISRPLDSRLVGVPLDVPAHGSRSLTSRGHNQTVTTPSPTNQPLTVTAERSITSKNKTCTRRMGSVVITQNAATDRRSCDHQLAARARSRPACAFFGSQLRFEIERDGATSIPRPGHAWSMYVRPSNSFFTGRSIRRLSEDHYRIKDGTFTNCDAKDGEVSGLAVHVRGSRCEYRGEHRDEASLALYAGYADHSRADVDLSLVNRHSGFLIPTPDMTTGSGCTTSRGYFWAINPSQDLTIAPSYYNNLGYGSDFTYRYYLNRRSSGQWFASFLQQTKLPNVSGWIKSTRMSAVAGMISGQHYSAGDGDADGARQASFVSDRQYLQQLSNSGTQRASPSGESTFAGDAAASLRKCLFLASICSR